MVSIGGGGIEFFVASGLVEKSEQERVLSPTKPDETNLTGNNSNVTVKTTRWARKENATLNPVRWVH